LEMYTARSEMQGCPTIVFACVHVSTGRQQVLDGDELPVPRRGGQRGDALLRARVDVRVRRDEERDDLFVTGCEVERDVIAPIPGIDGCAVGEQQLHRLGVAMPCRDMQRRLRTTVYLACGAIGRRSRVEQLPHCFWIGGPCGGEHAAASHCVRTERSTSGTCVKDEREDRELRAEFHFQSFECRRMSASMSRSPAASVSGVFPSAAAA